jgi:hypothetical protein
VSRGQISIIQIGKDISSAKRYLSHGEFLLWVENEAAIPARTAQANMRVASWVSSKSAAVALLPPTALHALSSRTVPQEFVEEVLSGVEAGERIKLPLLRAQIKALRETAPQQRGGAASAEPDGESSDALGAHCPTATAAMVSNAVRILARADCR